MEPKKPDTGGLVYMIPSTCGSNSSKGTEGSRGQDRVTPQNVAGGRDLPLDVSNAYAGRIHQIVHFKFVHFTVCA